MTKQELIYKISKKTGVQPEIAKVCVEAFMQSVVESVEDGENVFLRGFGSFQIKKKTSKKARDINKNRTIIIPEHYTPIFKPSDVFIERVKSKNSEQ